MINWCAFQKFFEFSRDLLGIVDKNGRLRYLNPSWTRILQWSETELRSKPLQEFLHPEDIPLALAETDPLQLGIPVDHFSVRMKCKNGSYKWILWSGFFQENYGFAIGKDITEQRQLTEQASRHALLFQHCQDAVFFTDSEGKITEWNTAAETLFGYTKEEVLGRTPEFLRGSSDDPALVSSIIQEVLKNKTKKMELPFIRKNGSSGYRHVTFIGIFSDQNILAGIISIHQDITQIKHQARLIQDLQEVANIGGWELDLATHQLHFTEQTYKIYELPVGTPLKQNDGWEFYPPGSRSLIQTAVKQSIEQNIPYDLELEFITAKGHPIWVRTKAKPVLKNKKVVRLIGTFQNITDKKIGELEKKEAALELEQTKTFLNLIIENIPSHILVKEAQAFRFVLINKSCENLLGYSKHELIGQTDYDLFPRKEADFVRNVDQKVLLQKKCIDVPKEEIFTADGQKRILHTKKIPILNDRGKPIYLLGISEDITQQEETKIILAKQSQVLETSARLSSLGEMAGGIAHEINNPLAIICGKARQITKLLSNSHFNKEKIKFHIKKIEQTALRIVKIIQGLQTFAREGKEDPITPCPLNKIMEDTASICFQKFKYHGISLRIDPIPADAVIPCRSVQISQVLLNLLNNSCDAVVNHPNAWIQISTHVNKNFVEVAVMDSGAGIPTELQHKIMEPFFTTKEVGKGTGLGLSISTGIIQQHGGFLFLDSQHPNTRFVIQLPKALQLSTDSDPLAYSLNLNLLRDKEVEKN